MDYCEFCGKEIEHEPLELSMYGSCDFFIVNVCNECKEIYELRCEEMSPEEIDKLILGDE